MRGKAKLVILCLAAIFALGLAAHISGIVPYAYRGRVFFISMAGLAACALSWLFASGRLTAASFVPKTAGGKFIALCVVAMFFFVGWAGEKEVEKKRPH